MDKLLIVDGMNLLFQMFYGMPARILSPKGLPIHGTMGFLGALRKLFAAVQPTHVAVVFDGECENFRRELDGSYKANRPDYSQLPPEETPFCQLPDVYRALELLGICHAETVCCEADDWMAAMALRWGRETDVVICSFDSDLFQLISDRISVLRYRGEASQLWDRAVFESRYGIAPRQYPDHKALTGDASDNIPGIRGIGAKTATKLLRRFSCLEELLQRVEEIEKEPLRRALTENAERLRQNCRLIRLDGTHMPPFTPEQLRWEGKSFTTRRLLSELDLL